MISLSYRDMQPTEYRIRACGNSCTPFLYAQNQGKGVYHMAFDYTSKRWRRKRIHILKRDGYLCREAKRYGKRVEADTVHHIYPADIYPKYAYCDWNLISLSSANHDAMHDRLTHNLTDAGMYWLTRTSPPPPKAT